MVIKRLSYFYFKMFLISQKVELLHRHFTPSLELFSTESKNYYYYVFILSAISPYTTGLKALFNQSDCTGTAPTHK